MNHDTASLLKHCSAGAKMAVFSIEDILPHTQQSTLRAQLEEEKRLHESLALESDRMLRRAGKAPASPGAMARQMSKMKIGWNLRLRPSDHTVAKLMTDGCSMGSAALVRCLNQNSSADVAARDTARRLIGLEDTMIHRLRPYL